jgi:DNA-binding FrmR family transcriptional regulator
MATTTRRGAYQANKADLVKRFHRVNGQILGIRQMVEEERYCPDVLVQLSSAIGALEKIGYILLRDHIRHHVVAGVAEGQGDEYLDELMGIIQRFSGH